MFNIPKEYELIEKYDLSGIDSKGYLLKHKKSDARISVVSNTDNNKVFYIGFRTTPEDSTGVAHILEHSVLCGSKKYPLKDPFVELAKGSLNTFLNAMTYPDKTVYPIASTNDKDFANLIDVYLDAVLNPNIYDNEKIFKQEGWHYELPEDSKGNLTINGVVYNEMKGAFSSPDDLLEREILNALFPDNTYAFESGGDPEDIPKLRYEDFLNFHRRYYHPSNSYIYLYGDCDMEERLTYLDKEYLSKYDAINPDSAIDLQASFGSMRTVEKEYPVAVGDDVRRNNYYSVNYVIENILDAKLYQAFNIIDYAILNSPGAPVREALMKKGIGKDIIGGYSNGTLQPYFSIGVKGAKPSDKKRFLDITKDALIEVVKKGIDKKAILAAINLQEFSFREADFGSYPKGLVYGLVCLDSWLYDDNKPYLHLDTIPVLDELKREVETDYFERLIEKYLLNNPHSVFVNLKPKEGLAGDRDEKKAQELSEYLSSLSETEKKKIAEDTTKLKEYQSIPTSPEDLKKLPLLSLSDLGKNIRPFKNRKETVDNTDIIYHDINTNGISYLNFRFDLCDIAKEDIKPLSLMIRMIGLLNTNKHTYAQLANEINVLTGGVYSHLQIYTNVKDKLCFQCVVGAKYLKEHTREAIDLALETVLDTDFSDNTRLKELLNQEIEHFKSKMNSSGHMVSSARALAHFSKEGYLGEMISGIEFYHYLLEIYKDYDNKIEEFKKICKRLTKSVFKKEALTVDITGKEELTKEIASFIPKVKERLSDEAKKETLDLEIDIEGNEGFKTAAAIQYVSRAGNYRKEGREYSGSLNVLKTILSYEYLWTNIRVLGGAYGCMVNFKRNGDFYLVSYRDPNLSETDKVFMNTPKFVKEFSCDERDMTKYIIGTVSRLDTPLTPAQEGDRSYAGLISQIGEDDLQRERDEVLSATIEDINNLSQLINDALSDDVFVVLGAEKAIDEQKELFDGTSTLI